MRPRASVLAWPYLVGLALLIGLPALAALTLAFTRFTGLTSPEAAGLDNFDRLFADAAFWRALGNSLVYVAIAVPLRMAAAIGAALLLHGRARGSGVGRVVAYGPSVIPDVAWALLWLWLLNPLFGPLALAASTLGFGSSGILTDPWATRIAIAMMGAFQIGEAFVIALAARRLIPQPLYEAASVDGASAWFTVRRVTLPLMAPAIGLLALRDVVLSFQLNFVPALIITDGGPRYATTYVPLYLYRTAFRYFRLGYASAMSVFLFAVTGLVLYVQYRLARRSGLI
ncbi:MAG: sugar ABC transporter permease [Actinomycetota bacterium]|nr:sugar ABC transporter permease [Actinomycetota bacterium]